jgi:hypothetical protein
MELSVKNLGRLKEARLTIKPLTVFVGPNHTNKTWTAYSLYGIARNLARVEFGARRSLGFAVSAALQAKIEATADELLGELIGKPALEVKARVTTVDVCRGLLASEPTFSLDALGLGAVLGIPESAFTGATAHLHATPDEFRAAVYSALEVIYKPSGLELEWRFIREDGTPQAHPYILRVAAKGRTEASRAFAEAKTILRENLVSAVGLLAYTLFDDAVVLPAERKALLSLDQMESYRPSLADAREATFASPIYDFMYMVDAARRLRNVPAVRPKFPLALARVLRDRIIQGDINFEDHDQPRTSGAATPIAISSRTNGDPHGSLTYVTNDGIDLSIHAAAAIVRSLAGLDIYLKDYCDRGGLLVIDEPELNAHPEAQLKIIEFLALLVHHGVRVVLTTHSPYVVDHLSNLMQASRLGETGKNSIASRFKLGMSEAFLSPDDVSVYLFNESGDVDDLLDREQGMIDLTSFSRPTEYMTNLVNAIWDAVDNEAHDTVEHGNAA